jgi:peptidoglycan/xylan/chitin deacetylase (PgdA/CDA1 family)
MFYLFKTPYLIQKLLPNYLWRKDAYKKAIYLSFDDGPTPIVTSWVLQTLKDFNAKATFFCIGKNAEKNPEIVANILRNGHKIGNHTHSHLNGWKTNSIDYLIDVELANTSLLKIIKSPKNISLFRPAYGKITFKQAKKLRKQNCKIVLWDVLSGDFDQKLSPVKSLQKVLKHTRSGSIIVFHDSIKAQNTLQFVLPKALEYWEKEGYEFLAI